MATSENGPTSDKLHVVAIPYPAQGHITPALQLCLELADRGCAITFVNSLHIHARIQEHSAAALDALHAAKGIRVVSIAGGLPPELHGYKSAGAQALQASWQMQTPFEELVAGLPRVDCILADALLGWASHSAALLQLPLLVFWPASAATFAALMHFSDLAAQGATGLPAEAHPSVVSDIPGLPPTRTRDLPDVVDETGRFTPLAVDLVFKPFRDIPRIASCVLVNTFAELEDAAVRALSARLPTYAVGPLLHKEAAQQQLRPSLFPEDQACLAWLDGQEPSSVLYVSFGSISVRSKKQMEELAMGLKATKLPFLWVGRRPSKHAAAEDEEGGKVLFDARELVEEGAGMVVAWAPQLQVLAHPSVGGFMTHCGWNSVVESVAMGVPMLCWADTGERASNQRFVTEIWECGVAMTQGDIPGSATFMSKQKEAVVLGREEVERIVRRFMGEDGAHLRARAAQLKAAAVAASDTSSSNLDEVVKSLIK